MFEIGRLALKIAGRDSGKKCVIIDILDKRHVLIDGQTRRRKCNIMHIEPLDKVIDIKKNASHDEVKSAFKELGLEIKDTKPKPKQERPKKQRGKIKVKVEKKEKKKLFGKKKKVIDAQPIDEKKIEKKSESKEAGLEAIAGYDEEKKQVKKSDKKGKTSKKRKNKK